MDIILDSGQTPNEIILSIQGRKIVKVSHCGAWHRNRHRNTVLAINDVNNFFLSISRFGYWHNHKDMIHFWVNKCVDIESLLC